MGLAGKIKFKICNVYYNTREFNKNGICIVITSAQQRSGKRFCSNLGGNCRHTVGLTKSLGDLIISVKNEFLRAVATSGEK